MKKMVYVGYCDVCGREIDCKATRFAIQMGSGNWNNDTVQWTNTKDLCRDCYDTVTDLLKSDQRKKPVARSKANEGPKPAQPDGKPNFGRPTKYPIEKIYEAYCNGWTNSRIQKEFGIPSSGMTSYLVKKIKATGAVRGENQMPDLEEQKAPVQFRTVVDGSNGLVLGVK